MLHSVPIALCTDGIFDVYIKQIFILFIKFHSPLNLIHISAECITKLHCIIHKASVILLAKPV